MDSRGDTKEVLRLRIRSAIGKSAKTAAKEKESEIGSSSEGWPRTSTDWIYPISISKGRFDKRGLRTETGASRDQPNRSPEGGYHFSKQSGKKGPDRRPGGSHLGEHEKIRYDLIGKEDQSTDTFVRSPRCALRNNKKFRGTVFNLETVAKGQRERRI